MKKLSFVFLFVFSTALVYGQGLAFGLKGGLNFPSADALSIKDGISISDAQGASGYHFGLFGRAKVSKIAVQPEVLYSFQSFDFKFTDVNLGGTTVYDAVQKFHYLTVPVMLKVYLAAGVNVQVGPQFGFLMSSVQQDDISGSITSSDIKDKLKGSDLGANFGAGIDLPFGLDIHARYVLGLSDVNSLASSVTAVKNSMFQVSIAYALADLGK
ncbi:MAG: PorT family protein [Cyclobacteriaceae bacterium]|nr:PorT family protein [Cyclobacteriaceae bacterium]